MNNETDPPPAPTLAFDNNATQGFYHTGTLSNAAQRESLSPQTGIISEAVVLSMMLSMFLLSVLVSQMLFRSSPPAPRRSERENSK